jgi:hypothetical protein
LQTLIFIATNLQKTSDCLYNSLTMNAYPISINDSFLDIAGRIDQDLKDNFGQYPAEAQVSLREIYLPIANRLTMFPYGANSEYNVIDIDANLAALANPLSRGQVLGLKRTITVHGKAGEIVNPIIIEGTSSDGRGLHITLLQDLLNPNAPTVSDLQDVLLRTFSRLNEKGVGSSQADVAIGSGTTAAAELGHQYLGLRTITNPALAGAIAAGQHPVHSWINNGIAETVSQRTNRMPGMYDIRMPDGRERRVTPARRTVYPGDGVTLLYHPSYKGEARYGHDLDLPPERLAVAIGIKAAESMLGIPVASLRSRMFESLEAVGRT